MANNYVAKDGVGTLITLESSEDTPSVQTPVHHVKTLPTDPLGASADVATSGDSGGTISAKLRALVKWATLAMPASLGQKTMANSLPVVLASDSASIGIGASELNLGFINRHLVVLSQVPTITALSAYAVGDCIGGLIAFANAARVAAGSGRILAGLLGDAAMQTPSMQLLLFDANPTSSTFNDKSAAVLDPSDLGKLIGNIPFLNYLTVGLRDFSHVESKVAFALASGQTIWGALVLQGENAPPTFATAADITVKLWIEQN